MHRHRFWATARSTSSSKTAKRVKNPFRSVCMCACACACTHAYGPWRRATLKRKPGDNVAWSQMYVHIHATYVEIDWQIHINHTRTHCQEGDPIHDAEYRKQFLHVDGTINEGVLILLQKNNPFGAGVYTRVCLDNVQRQKQIDMHKNCNFQ